MITISGYINTRVCLYTIITCTDVATIDRCPFMLLVSTCAVCIWPGYINYDMYLYRCYAIATIYLCHSLCAIISLHPPS